MATIFEDHPPTPQRYRDTKLVYLAYDDCKKNPDYVWCLKAHSQPMKGRKGKRWDSSRNEGWKPVAKVDLKPVKMGPFDIVGPAHLELKYVADDPDESDEQADD